MPSHEVTVNILVELDRFEEVAQGVEKAGVAIDLRNPDIGTVSGRVDSRVLPVVEQVAGVLGVETAEREFSLPPPSSDLQ